MSRWRERCGGPVEGLETNAKDAKEERKGRGGRLDFAASDVGGDEVALFVEAV